MATAKMLEIKNWRKFQHYKDRSPPWIKLYASVFDDAEFACLKDTSKLALICIWILSRQLDGKVPNCAAWIKKRAGLDGDVDLQDLIDNGFLIPLADCAQDASNLSQNRDNMPPSENREEENTNTPLPPKGGTGEGNPKPESTFKSQLNELTAADVAAEYWFQIPGRKKPQLDDITAEFEEKARVFGPGILPDLLRLAKDPARDKTQKLWEFWVAAGLKGGTRDPPPLRLSHSEEQIKSVLGKNDEPTA